MDRQTRRYLSEDWDDHEEPSGGKREDKKPGALRAKQVTIDRRQAEKAWGKAHAKWWKQVKQSGGGKRGPS